MTPSVRAEVNRLSPTRDILTGTSSNDQVLVSQAFSDRRKERAVDLSELYKALQNEFRVSLAQGIILGEESPARTALKRALETQSPFDAPLGIVPGEYVEFYRNQRTTLN